MDTVIKNHLIVTNAIESCIFSSHIQEKHERLFPLIDNKSFKTVQFLIFKAINYLPVVEYYLKLLGRPLEPGIPPGSFSTGEKLLTN